MQQDSQSIPELVAEAKAHDAAGRLDQAAACCQALLERNSENRFALSLLANLAMRGGQLNDAVALCERVVAVAPDDPILHLNLGMCLLRSERFEEAINSFAQATRLDPSLAIAHLYAGGLLHKQGQTQAAIEAWCDAFNAEPSLRGAYLRADANEEIKQLSVLANGALRDAHYARHQAAVAPWLDQMQPAAADRMNAFLRHFHGYQQIPWADPLQKPNYMYYPGLPARAWFEREEFNWLPELEGAAQDIRRECAQVMQAGQGIAPYLDHIPSAPPQMKDLMGSSQWTSYHLLAQGRAIEEHCEACPVSYAALRKMPLPVGQDQSPEAFFSILKPDTHIPPHFGVSNTKVVVHLALEIPDQCGLRAGTETRHWQPGQCLIFDDSFEHEAWNRSDSLRSVLITEVWNPALTQPECDALVAVLAATAQWHQYIKREGAAEHAA